MVPLWTALAGGESTSFVQGADDMLSLGGQNTSPGPSSMLAEVRSADGALAGRFTSELPAGGAVLESIFVPGGSVVLLSNTSKNGSLVPLGLRVWTRPSRSPDCVAFPASSTPADRAVDPSGKPSRMPLRAQTVLLVEQNTEHALRIASRGFVLESGRVVLAGTGAELLENQRVREAYLGL